MAKAIFTAKMTPAYDDLPEERYHFPSTYLNVVRRAVGDQIIYYEPRRSSAEDSSRGGRQAYFAIARVTAIEDDPNSPDLHYARIDNFLNFDTAVPWRLTGGTFESSLVREDGGTNKGQFGRSVREIPDHEFQAILRAGFHDDPWDERGLSDGGAGPRSPSVGGVQEEADEFERPLIEQTLVRPFRDQAFRRAVRNAYGHQCALTGLALRNGGGRPEVQAAHIKPVSHLGPDSTRNGLALSGTLHWMFDRGLVSVDEDYRILKAKSGLPEQIEGLLRPDGKILLPDSPADWPHPKFLRHHREVVFKG